MALPEAPITIIQFDDAVASALTIANPSRPSGDVNATLHGVQTGGLAALHATMPDIEAACCSILPRHEATLRIIGLPSQDATELESMVTLAAADFVPYPIEEMQVCHQAIRVLPTGESVVLVVLVQRAIIEAHLAALAAQGMEPTEILLSTACLVARARSLDLKGPIALLHVEPKTIELVVVQEGVIQFSRGIAQSEVVNLDTAEGLEALISEVRDLLVAHRREDESGQGIDTLFISSAGLDVTALVDVLHEQTGKDCQPLADATNGTTIPATFTGALAILRGEGPINLSLAPSRIGRRQAQRALNRRATHYGALATVILVAMTCWFVQAVIQKKSLIAELQEQVDIVSPNAQGVAAKQHSLQIIARQVDRGGSFLEILAGVAEAAPPADLNLTRIEFDRESGLSLWGRARTKDLILHDFLGAMRNRAEGNLSLFASAHSLYETQSTERNEPVFNYQIAVPILDNEEAPGGDPISR